MHPFLSLSRLPFSFVRHNWAFHIKARIHPELGANFLFTSILQLLSTFTFRLLTFLFSSRYHGEEIKQADVVLLPYPLLMDMPTQVHYNDLVYYEARTDPNGPAMTYAPLTHSPTHPLAPLALTHTRAPRPRTHARILH